MNDPDRLYRLVPAVVRRTDTEQGRPLQALLRVVAEQVDVVEADIEQLYRNWFIETADDWAVPYIGALIGYGPVREAGAPGSASTEAGRALNRILTPRREVANTLRYRRRKGALALLEQLTSDVAGWPSRAVEFYRLLATTQNVNALRVRRGRIADLRDGDTLELVDGPFDRTMHTADVRRIASRHDPGRHNIPSVGLFVWRLLSIPVTRAPAHAAEDVGPHAFTFSALANDGPLFAAPEPEQLPTDIAAERNLPVAIRRRRLERLRLAGELDEVYGPARSFAIWTGSQPELVPVEALVPADLTDWRYRATRGHVAVDPELGRLAFPPNHPPKRGVWVSYRYGFSAEMGGGEYERPLSEPAGAALYRVGPEADFSTIGEAVDRWREEAPTHAVIEIMDSGVYAEQIELTLHAGRSLQLRAANRRRPILRLLDWRTDRSDALLVTGEDGGHFTLDGIVVTGRGMQIEGRVDRVTIRHSTLVPGWGLDANCRPRRPGEASVILLNTTATLCVMHSIVGSIRVIQDEVKSEPRPVWLADSILDATSRERCALSAPEEYLAHAVATIARTTVIGGIRTHAIELAENSILFGETRVARRQHGCVRFCWVEPGSRTPRRYHCQPDLVDEAVKASFPAATPPAQVAAALERERLRVRPQFSSLRYGRPTYCQLARSCSPEIARGADDESELGAFHDLYQPQRLANLRARLDEYTPAGMEAGIILAT